MFAVKRSATSATLGETTVAETRPADTAAGAAKATKAGAVLMGTTGVTSERAITTTGAGKATEGADGDAAAAAGAEGGGVKYCTGAPGPWS
jgi:hypothetical protein